VNALLEALRAAGGLLDASGRRWALVGGLGVSARAEPRFTRDVDLAVAVSDDRDAEQLVRRFAATGHRAVTTVEQEAAGRLATVRLAAHPPQAAALFVDLLFASSGIEREVVEEAEVLDLAPGLRVPVAQAGHLVALKVLSRGPERPQDEADIRSLLAVLDDAQRERARASARRIQERGYARGKSMVEEMEALLRR
jgi:predicted nucleotidyltransferase